MPQPLHPPSPDRLGRWVLKEKPDAMGLRVRKDLKDLPARRVPPVSPAQRENPALSVLRVLPDLLDRLAVRKHAR
jgi:hypothetical protein